MGSTRNRKYFELDSQGIGVIAGRIEKYNLDEVNRELKESGLIPTFPCRSLLDVEMLASWSESRMYGWTISVGDFAVGERSLPVPLH